MKSNKFKYLLVGALLSTAFLAGCTQPKAVDEIKIIGPSDTAFLVALDGDTLKNQNSMKSAEFLESAKISAKRVLIPHKIINTCPDCNTGDYSHYLDVPTAQLFTVSRAPVARSWTSSAATGTSAKNEAFSVESNESIDFDIGATIIAHVAEADTAKFLYLHSGSQLETVIDGQVRNYVSSILSREMGSHNIDWDRQNKNAVFTTAFNETKTFFAAQGITIDSLGFTEGMTYHDPAIQKAINAKFAADMNVQIAEKTLEAANQYAQAKDAVKVQQDIENRKRELDLQAAAIAKWDGKLPVTNASGAMPFVNLK